MDAVTGAVDVAGENTFEAKDLIAALLLKLGANAFGEGPWVAGFDDGVVEPQIVLIQSLFRPWDIGEQNELMPGLR
jgi:hypothetical protein